MLETLQNKWNEILDYIKQEYDITDVSFNTWLSPLQLHSVSNGIVTIIVDEEPALEYIRKKFTKYFKVTITEFMHEEVEIEFLSPNKVNEVKTDFPSSHNSNNSNNNNSNNNNKYNTTVIKDNSLELKLREANLNPKYTFDSFVVGGNNNFAHAYALKVAEAPGEIRNPLFLYGGSGLGKTHLMHSIGHYILEHHIKEKVLYVTSETFTNELINVIRNENQNTIAVNEFRNKYRNIDVLLIDDIQFIIGKERSQEEFFHTFNALHESKKQIIISSDKSPRELTMLEERLRNRFEWGLSVDISFPDYETRMAILQKKCELEDYYMDDDILDYIATNIVSNIRELEGALAKVISYSKISPLQINLELAKDILKDSIVPNSQIKVTSPLIIQMVSEHFGLADTDIASKKKSQDIAIPRQIAMYLCRLLTEDSYSYIASLIGNRHYSTVIHGYEKISADIQTNEQLNNTIEVIKKKILPS